MPKCEFCGRPKLSKRLKAGVILIGGSLKGIYGHTGVMSAIQELKNHGLDVEVIVGASAGSVIASFYAAGMSKYQICKKMLSLRGDDFIDRIPKLEMLYEFIVNKGRHFYGFLKGDRLEQYMSESLGEKDDFDKMTIPLYISAVSLSDYKLMLFNAGKVSQKVRASTSVPILFCPKKIHDVHFIDGAIMRDQLPDKLHELHPDLDLIIASSFVHEPTAPEKDYLENAKMPMLEITRRVLSMQERFEWPKKLGRTRVIKITPSGLRPVDFFHPNRTIAREIFSRSKTLASNIIGQELNLL